jgi:RNA polymerase sigma factor (sigma-70 family)
VSFETIYRRYHQELYRYCLAIVGNPEDAQDALQNTMVKAMRALQGEKRQIKLKPWLYRIAHNESIDQLRGRRPTEEIDAELTAAGPDTAETAELRERLRRLIADLEELPDRQRGALVMRELSGLSFEQIGVAFDTSPAVARQTVYEARIGLQQMSEGRDMRCEEVCRALSDGDGRTIRRRDIRAHLRTCPSCSAFRDGVTERRRDLAALSPLPVVASAGLLHAILAGGQGSSSGAGLAGAVGAGAGKAVATSAIVKSAATVAVVAAVGVSAADRGNLIHVGLPGDGTSHNSQTGGGAPPAAGAEAEPSAQALKTSTEASGQKSASKTQVKTPNGDDAVGAEGASHGHGGNTTAPGFQLPPGTQHGKKGHGGGSQASHGKGHHNTATHGGHSHSSSHGHSHKTQKPHPHPSPPSHPSPPPSPPKPHVSSPPPSPSPPASPDTTSGNPPDNSSSATFHPTE